MNGTHAKLAADATGEAAVTWGATTFVVPLQGQGFHGSLPQPDVSKLGAVAGLAFTPVSVRTAGGWTLALQVWAPSGQPAAIHLARWRGDPTQVTITDTGTHLSGTATFQGKPVTGSSPTPSGTELREYVYLDCFGCSADPSGWSAMLGVATKADGSYSVLLRPNWMGSKYRASIEGPNIGATLAPDAQAFANAP
ncbi:MAG: hypothetical protein JOY73_11815 [Actinobacteria bacterium]|nr:hypothetical protein [Actinomycetota bacterium]